MDVIKRIKELTEERGWSQYKLAHEANLSMSTISNIFTRGTTPNVATLEILCEAFGITLTQFFSSDDMNLPVSPKQRKLLEHFTKLSKIQQDKLMDFLETLN